MFSNCAYFVEIGRMELKPSERSPSRNYITQCPHPKCEAVNWRYNMPLHFADKHAASGSAGRFDYLEELSHEEVSKVKATDFVIKSRKRKR